MAVVEEGSCEGCGETFDVDDLHVVTIQGEELVCCAECRRHAQRVSAQAKPSCDGCGAPTPESDLEPVELPDGVEIDCCPDCRTEADVDLSNDTHSGHRNRAVTDEEEPGAATTTDSSKSDTASVDAASDQQLETTEESDEDSRPATTANICDNCKESFTIELYQVETIDGRTEEFCPECKREGVDHGIVRDVQLRRAQAFEVLGLNSAADEDTVREAYLRRVKEVHPDREHGNRSEFMLVKRAYERLSDEV